MKRQVIHRKGPFIVVISNCKKDIYYTVINTRKSTHCHVDKQNVKGAIMICNYAKKGIVPDRYPDWMKNAIHRIL